MVAQLQFQMMHVVYEIRVTMSTKISADHCREARCRCFDMVVVRGWLGLLFHAEKPRAKGRRRPASASSREKVPDVLTKTEDSRRVSAATLRTFLTDALRACGLSEADAATVAGAMLEADLTGSDAHGVFRLPGYVRQLKRGVMNPKANITVVERSPATALIDGDHGMGHVVMTAAANLAVELARASGVGWVGVRRSNHAGAGAIYAAIPLAHGMVGIYGVASSVNHMAPWGGTEPLLGTNPIAVAIPAGDEAPVILDIATSLASNGAIRTHQLEGRPMPEGWVQNRTDGAPITDPGAINHGTYLPMGGYKGSGLSIIIGLLAGPLNGAAFGRDIKDFAAPPSGELNVGQFVIALDVARFVPPDLFKAEVDRHIRDLASSRQLPGVEEIRVPGQGRAARRTEREKGGIPLSATVVAQVDEVAKSLGITPLSARA
jgi:LDH2 family malate/lactate/ureidoglycolate dehydrogenase